MATSNKKTRKKPVRRTPPKNKGGRPTRYKKEFVAQALKLTIMGATDKDLADFFEVDERTINRWKKTHKEFCQSIKSGKTEADANVASSLYKKAIGYKTVVKKPFKIRTTINGEGSKERIEVVEVVEQYPPDATSAIFWLKNRQPKKWRDTKNIDHTTGGESLNKPRNEREERIEELLKKRGNVVD